jgi:hypothetical protein
MNTVKVVKLPVPDSGLECDCMNVGLTCTKDHLLSYLFEHGSRRVKFYFNLFYFI